jgi:hypothetical protein
MAEIAARARDIGSGPAGDIAMKWQQSQGVGTPA